MAWTIDNAIRVGDTVDSELLGQMALEIDALHDGFVTTTGSAGSGAALKAINNALNLASGIKGSFITGISMPYVVYSFENGYKRKAPYIVVATVGMTRATNRQVAGWIVRTPHYVTDFGRESDATTQYDPLWDVELRYNSIISNIDGTEPDGYLTTTITSPTYMAATMVRLVTDDYQERYQYSDGTTLTHYNDYFHVAVNIRDGTTADPVILSGASMTIIGGR